MVGASRQLNTPSEISMFGVTDDSSTGRYLVLKVWASFREFSRLRWIGMGLTYPQHLNCQLIFDGPLNQKEEKFKATYILLWIGEEGRKIFNSFELSDEERQKIDVIFDKFTRNSCGT